MKTKKENSFQLGNLMNKSLPVKCILGLAMGCFYFLPLIINSFSVSVIGQDGHLIGWPVLMFTIIFCTSMLSIVRGGSEKKLSHLDLFGSISIVDKKNKE